MDIKSDLYKLNYLGQLPDGLNYNRKPFSFNKDYKECFEDLKSCDGEPTSSNDTQEKSFYYQPQPKEDIKEKPKDENISSER